MRFYLKYIINLFRGKTEAYIVRFLLKSLVDSTNRLSGDYKIIIPTDFTNTYFVQEQKLVLKPSDGEKRIDVTGNGTVYIPKLVNRFTRFPEGWWCQIRLVSEDSEVKVRHHPDLVVKYTGGDAIHYKKLEVVNGLLTINYDNGKWFISGRNRG